LAEDLQARDQQLREAKTFLDRLEQLIWVALGQLGIQEGRSPLDDSAVTALTELLDARLRNRDPWRDLIRSSLSCALAAWEDVASVVAERDDGAILNRALELDRVRDGLNGLCERLEAYYAVRVDGRAADERSLWYDVLKGALLDNFGGQVFQASDLLEKIFGDEPDLIRLKALLQSVGASLAALYALDADLKVQTARILDVLPKEVKDIDWTFGRSDRYWEIKRYRDLAPRLEKLKKATDVPEEGPVVAIKRIGWRRGDEGRPLAVILYSPGDWRDEQK
jgi:hypothetical protein